MHVLRNGHGGTRLQSQHAGGTGLGIQVHSHPGLRSKTMCKNIFNDY